LERARRVGTEDSTGRAGVSFEVRAVVLTLWAAIGPRLKTAASQRFVRSLGFCGRDMLRAFQRLTHFARRSPGFAAVPFDIQSLYVCARSGNRMGSLTSAAMPRAKGYDSTWD
jgi:hypothetical protein